MGQRANQSAPHAAADPCDRPRADTAKHSTKPPVVFRARRLHSPRICAQFALLRWRTDLEARLRIDRTACASTVGRAFRPARVPTVERISFGEHAALDPQSRTDAAGRDTVHPLPLTTMAGSSVRAGPSIREGFCRMRPCGHLRTLTGTSSRRQARRSHSSIRPRCRISRGVNVRRGSSERRLDSGHGLVSSDPVSSPPTARKHSKQTTPSVSAHPDWASHLCVRWWPFPSVTPDMCPPHLQDRQDV